MEDPCNSETFKIGLNIVYRCTRALEEDHTVIFIPNKQHEALAKQCRGHSCMNFQVKMILEATSKSINTTRFSLTNNLHKNTSHF